METDNPDLRDRAYIYWRLLSTDPEVSGFAFEIHTMCFNPLQLHLHLSAGGMQITVCCILFSLLFWGWGVWNGDEDNYNSL